MNSIDYTQAGIKICLEFISIYLEIIKLKGEMAEAELSFDFEGIERAKSRIASEWSKLPSIKEVDRITQHLMSVEEQRNTF